MDAAAKDAGAGPVGEVSLEGGASFSECELNRVWLDEGDLVVVEAEDVLGGDPEAPAL